MDKKIIFAFILGILTPLIAGFIFLISGGMPVATKAPPLPLEQYVARTALHAAMRNEINKLSPVEPTEENLVAGAKAYSDNCIMCHGVINDKPSGFSAHLFPPPPQLLSPDGYVTDDPVGEIYWKIKNGIRLTGMPAFVNELTDKELWQISEFLLHADQLPESAKKALDSDE